MSVSNGSDFARWMVDFFAVIFAPVALALGAGGAALIAVLTRVVRNAIAKRTDRPL